MTRPRAREDVANAHASVDQLLAGRLWILDRAFTDTGP